MIQLIGIIDRFEGDFVVVEINGETKDFPKIILPKDANIGDVIEIKGNNVQIMKDKTLQRKKEIEELMKELWED